MITRSCVRLWSRSVTARTLNNCGKSEVERVALYTVALRCKWLEGRSRVHVDLTKNLFRKLGHKRIRKGNQNMCVSDCPCPLDFFNVCFLTCAIESASKLQPKKKSSTEILCQGVSVVHVVWLGRSFFCVQESKIGSCLGADIKNLI